MSAGKPEGDRDVIPRWRHPRSAPTRAELYPVQAQDRPVDKAGLHEREGDWHRTPTLGFALDLVGTAVVLGASDSARTAADMVLANSSTSQIARKAAKRVLSLPDSDVPAVSDPSTPETRAQIRRLKQRLGHDPRNALGWTEIARYYTILGQREKAANAMQIAVYLFPDHRYVLRAAVRLAVHHGELDRAHAAVAKAASILLTRGLWRPSWQPRALLASILVLCVAGAWCWKEGATLRARPASWLVQWGPLSCGPDLIVARADLLRVR